jgi:hypothetical protein
MLVNIFRPDKSHNLIEFYDAPEDYIFGVQGKDFTWAVSRCLVSRTVNRSSPGLCGARPPWNVVGAFIRILWHALGSCLVDGMHCGVPSSLPVALSGFHVALVLPIG